MRLTQPIKFHGGKHYIANKIIELMPPHKHYVECHAGGLSVLLHKNPEGVSEVVNDISLDLTIFWRVLASETHFPEFLRQVQATPFSEFEWARAANVELLRGELSVPAARTAAAFFIRCRQSLAGRMNGFAPLSRNRTRNNMNEQASAWLGALEGLPAVHERLRRVVILNRDALDVIKQQDGPDTLYYCDPPYLQETRASPEVYEYEMGEAQHEDLLKLLGTIQGKFLLSGYRSKLYDEYAETFRWKRHEFSVPNNAAGGKTKRAMIECVWLNF
jgi:DNA adenine methylase